VILRTWLEEASATFRPSTRSHWNELTGTGVWEEALEMRVCECVRARVCVWDCVCDCVCGKRKRWRCHRGRKWSKKWWIAVPHPISVASQQVNNNYSTLLPTLLPTLLLTKSYKVLGKLFKKEKKERNDGRLNFSARKWRERGGGKEENIKEKWPNRISPSVELNSI